MSRNGATITGSGSRSGSASITNTAAAPRASKSGTGGRANRAATSGFDVCEKHWESFGHYDGRKKTFASVLRAARDGLNANKFDDLNEEPEKEDEDVDPDDPLDGMVDNGEEEDEDPDMLDVPKDIMAEFERRIREVASDLKNTKEKTKEVVRGRLEGVKSWGAYKDDVEDPLERIYGDTYIRGALTATVAPGGVGKSALALAEAVAIVTMRPIYGEQDISSRGWPRSQGLGTEPGRPYHTDPAPAPRNPQAP